jgi:hypothetical protein
MEEPEAVYLLMPTCPGFHTSKGGQGQSPTMSLTHCSNTQESELHQAHQGSTSWYVKANSTTRQESS